MNADEPSSAQGLPDPGGLNIEYQHFTSFDPTAKQLERLLLSSRMADGCQDFGRGGSAPLGSPHPTMLYARSCGDTSIGVRVTSGMLTTSGFTPAPDPIRAGAHGECPAG